LIHKLPLVPPFIPCYNTLKAMISAAVLKGHKAGFAADSCVFESSDLSIEILLLISKYTIKKQEEMDGK